MGLAMFRHMSGWVAMLCVAIALALVGQTTAQAFEMAEHAGHHAARAVISAVDAHHHCDEGGHDQPAESTSETHHHHSVDHHSVGLGVDATTATIAPPGCRSVAPTRSVHRPGLGGYGIERPPKA
jgi:hypothetical protein